jgi:hypothetical protein
VLSREKEQDPALLMYFLDSGGGSYPEVISAAQVGWFESQSQFLNPDGRSTLQQFLITNMVDIGILNS